MEEGDTDFSFSTLLHYFNSFNHMCLTLIIVVTRYDSHYCHFIYEETKSLQY